MRRVGVGASLCAALLIAAWAAWVHSADAAFPGRDGRLTWVESEFIEGGEAEGPPGTNFFVFQRPLKGERLEDIGGLVCDNRIPPDLCPYGNPSFSPDGETVVLETGRAPNSEDPPPFPRAAAPPRKPVIALVGADERSGGSGLDPPPELAALPELTDADRDPAWSPDGQRIVFSGEVGGDRDLYVVNRDGSGLTRITSGPALDREPNWSTRGEIAFVRGRVLYRVRPDGTDLKRFDRRGRRPDWSPDGRRLVFSHERRLFLLRRDGLHYRRVLRRGLGMYPAWSPSGRRIAFRRSLDIYTSTPRGGGLRRVYDSGCPCSPSRKTPLDIDWGPRQR